MILGRVIGSVVSTVKNHHFEGEKLLIVQPVDLDGNGRGPSFLALDRVSSGKGDLVLVNKEGGGARIIYGEVMPVQAVIVGVVDGIDLEWPENRGSRVNG